MKSLLFLLLLPPLLASAQTPTPTPQETHCAVYGDYSTCQTTGEYPPTETCGCMNLGPYAARSLLGGVYDITSGLLGWDIHMNADVERAVFRIIPTMAMNANDRSVSMDWYDYGETCDSSDNSTLPLGGAFAGWKLSDLTLNEPNRILIDTPFQIKTDGMTKARFHISGDIPTGNNNLLFERGSACLELNFGPTHTPVGLTTSTPANTPTNTPTPKKTKKPKPGGGCQLPDWE